MHLMAERGVAAHWVYKIKRSKSWTDQRQQFVKIQLASGFAGPGINTLMIQKSFWKISRWIFLNRKFMFSLLKEILKSCQKVQAPIDFAYAIHTQVGERTSRSKSQWPPGYFESTN